MVNQLAKEGCRRVATTTCEFQDTHTASVSMYLARKYLVRTLFLQSLLETGPGFIHPGHPNSVKS